MAKCVAAYQPDSTASKSDIPITGQACCAQKPTARTTKAVIIFMGGLAAQRVMGGGPERRTSKVSGTGGFGR